MGRLGLVLWFFHLFVDSTTLGKQRKTASPFLLAKGWGRSREAGGRMGKKWESGRMKMSRSGVCVRRRKGQYSSEQSRASIEGEGNLYTLPYIHNRWSG